jgi:hypothetical protein
VTKIDDVTIIQERIKLLKKSEGVVVNSIGAFGGILTIWDTTCVENEVTFCSQNWILTVLRCKETSLKTTIINIYKPTRYMDKISCWNSLFVVKEYLDLSSCIIVGDFNTILHNSEKRGGYPIHDLMRERMEDLIMEWDLIYMKPIK